LTTDNASKIFILKSIPCHGAKVNSTEVAELRGYILAFADEVLTKALAMKIAVYGWGDVEKTAHPSN
jgi:hypothetical protein